MAVNRADKEYLDNIWRFDVGEVDGEVHTARLANLQRTAATTWKDIHGTHERRMKDETQTEGGRLLSSAKFARAALERRAGEFSDAMQDAMNAQRVYRNQLTRGTNPPSDPGEAAVFAEIRAHLRTLKHGERVVLVDQAFKADDMRVVHAAISGSTLVALLAPQVHEQYRNSYLATQFPNEYGRSVRLDAAIERAHAGQVQLNEHVDAIIDFTTADAVQRSAA